MELSDIFLLSSTVIGSIGGVGVIIIGISSWLSKMLAERILHKARIQHDKEMEKLKSDLLAQKEKSNFAYSMYFKGQFEVYNELWGMLIELKDSVEDLWVDPTKNSLGAFAKALDRTQKKLQKNALLLDEENYSKITSLMRTFSNYDLGKKNLLPYIEKQAGVFSYKNDEAMKIVEGNRENYENIKLSIDEIMDEMRKNLRDAGAILG